MSNVNSFDQQQADVIIKNNAAYDLLIFVQIPAEFFHEDLLGYLRRNATFLERFTDTNREFMFPVSDLAAKAIPQLNRYKDKTSVEQAKKLVNDLTAVQYIHVIY